MKSKQEIKEFLLRYISENQIQYIDEYGSLGLYHEIYNSLIFYELNHFLNADKLAIEPNQDSMTVFWEYCNHDK